MQVLSSNNQQMTPQPKDNHSFRVNYEGLYKLGFSYFGPDLKDRKHLRLFNGSTLSILEKEELRISLNKDQKWTKIISLIKVSDVNDFALQRDVEQPLLKQVISISFPHLIKLKLFSTHFTSFEPFSWLYAPNLEYVNIIYNNCVNFKSFNKLNLPNLKTLCIYVLKKTKQNQGVIAQNAMEQDANRQEEYGCHYSIQDYERWGMNLKELRLEKGEWDAVMMQDLSRIAKSKETLEQVYICPTKRINQQKVIERMKQKQKVEFIAFRTVDNTFVPYDPSVPFINERNPLDMFFQRIGIEDI